MKSEAATKENASGATMVAEKVSPVSLRPAQPDDSECVWEWNFTPDVRARSVSRRIVTFAEHTKWFAKRLANTEGSGQAGPPGSMTRGAPMWIIEEHGIGVGVLRIDPIASNLVTPARLQQSKISIALCERARGRGIGTRAIAQACAKWRRPIVAEIQPDNTASIKAFTACGFKEIARNSELVTYRWNP
jgi:L-amino acid N-acyltransferase YncA